MAIGRPTEEERAVLAEWMTANGVDPATVPLESTFAITDEPAGRLIHYIEFVLTSDGHKQVDPDHRDEVWTRTASVPCTVEPAPELRIMGARS